MDESEVACCCFIVARGEAAGAFELVEAALDPVPQGVGDCLDEDRFFTVDLARYDRCTATLLDDMANVVAIVAAVGDEHSGFRKILIDQCIETLEVGHFAAAYLRSDRQSVSVGNEMDLGRKATF